MSEQTIEVAPKIIPIPAACANCGRGGAWRMGDRAADGRDGGAR